MGLLTAVETGLRWVGARFVKDPGGLWLRWGREAHYVGQGLAYVRRSADLGYPEGILELGLYYAAGGYGAGGRQASEGLFRRSAEAGVAEAAFHLAEALRWRGKRAEALAWYRRAAEGGFRPAARWLARAYEIGDGVDADGAEAARWEALEAGLPPAEPRHSALVTQAKAPWRDPLVRLMWALQEAAEGLGEELAARPWFLPVAAALSVALATAAVAIPAAVILVGSAGLGYAPLLIMVPSLLMLFAMHRRMRKDHAWSKAHVLLLSRAEAGDPEANHQLGLAYLRGSDQAPRDAHEARRRFAVAAEAGHGAAAFQLSQLARWGAGGVKDPEQALDLLYRSAETGHRPALERLVQVLELGEGTEADPEAASRWRRRLEALPPEAPAPPPGAGDRWRSRAAGALEAAEVRGEELAHRTWFSWAFWALVASLGLLFLGSFVWFVVATPFGWMTGVGLVPMAGWAAWQVLQRDRGLSGSTRRRLDRAEGGDPEACYEHGLHALRGGGGVPKDAATARHWFQQAAAAGHLDAMVQLAEMLRWGQGGLRRPDEARAWLLRAVEAGHEAAKRQLEDLGAEEEPGGE